MCKFAENVRILREPMFVIGESKGHDAVVHHQHLFNCPSLDDIISQSVQKHVSCGGEVLLRK